MRLTHWAGPTAILVTLGAAGPEARAVAPATYAARRDAVLERLGPQLLIVPSQAAFKGDDQALFLQAPNFQYLVGESTLVGAVLVLDGQARSSTLFLAPPSRILTRPQLDTGAETAKSLAMNAVLPIADLDRWLGDRFTSVSGVLVAGTDPRGAVMTPPPMADTLGRWTLYLSSLGWRGPVRSGVTAIRVLRERKEPAEIAILERVGAASGRAMLAGLRALRPGRWQREAEAEVVRACAAEGARPSFWPWTMSGPHSIFTDLFNSFVDYESHNRQMQPGELVRVDVGCQLDHYMGDVGRTAPVSGRFSDGQREAWDLFIAGYRAGLPGSGTASRRVRSTTPLLRLCGSANRRSRPRSANAPPRRCSARTASTLGTARRRARRRRGAAGYAQGRYDGRLRADVRCRRRQLLPRSCPRGSGRTSPC